MPINSAHPHVLEVFMSTVAVLIPTYKPSWYLRRCLKSIDNQTLPKDKFKVYIALNGPKDNFEEVIHSALENTNFNYEFFYIEKAGVSNARNYLIDNSVEPFIAFVDDDDVLSSNYLENLLGKSNTQIMGICNVYNFKNKITEKLESNMGNCFNNLRSIEYCKYNKSRKYFSSPCAQIIHRKMIDDIRFDTYLARGEDSLFMAQISKSIKGLQKTSADTIYYACLRDGSASRRRVNKKEELERILYLLKEYLRLLFTKGYDKPFILTRIVATFKQLRNIF